MFEWSWLTEDGTIVTTRTYDYTMPRGGGKGSPRFVFQQVFPGGLRGCGLQDRDAISTVFPHFAGEPVVPLGILTFAGNMACPDDVRQRTWQGSYSMDEWGLVPRGMQGGGGDIPPREACRCCSSSTRLCRTQC